MSAATHLAPPFSGSYGPDGWVLDTPYFALEEELHNEKLRCHNPSEQTPDTIINAYIEQECSITPSVLRSQLGNDLCSRILSYTFWKVRV